MSSDTRALLFRDSAGCEDCLKLSTSVYSWLFDRLSSRMSLLDGSGVEHGACAFHRRQCEKDLLYEFEEYRAVSPETKWMFRRIREQERESVRVDRSERVTSEIVCARLGPPTAKVLRDTTMATTPGCQVGWRPP